MGENMAKSFIQIINELSNVSLPHEKKQLSIEAGKALKSRQNQASSIIVPIIEATKRSPEMKRFKEISEGDFYELEIRPYQDLDGFFHISIQVSFLQDFENFDNELSMKIGLFIFNELLKRNLEIVVNDICINDVQYRNGNLA